MITWGLELPSNANHNSGAPLIGQRVDWSHYVVQQLELHGPARVM